MNPGPMQPILAHPFARFGIDYPTNALASSWNSAKRSSQLSISHWAIGVPFVITESSSDSGAGWATASEVGGRKCALETVETSSVVLQGTGCGPCLRIRSVMQRAAANPYAVFAI
jgi:L-amino acid N-acyltransferase YncA